MKPSTSQSPCCRFLFVLSILALLSCVLILPYLLVLGHTLLPYPFHLIGADQDPISLTEEVTDYRTSLLRFNGPNTDAKVEGVVKLLRAHPKFAKHHPEGLPLGAPSPPPLHVITVASQWKPGLDLMRSTASLFGLEARVLGMGDTALVAWGQGLGRKVHHVLEFARAQGPEDMVLFVDAYDCVFMGRPSLEAYHRGLARAIVREPKDPSDSGGLGVPGGGLAAVNPDPASPLPPNLLNRRLPTILVSAEPFCMDRLPNDKPNPTSPRAIPSHLRAGQRFPCLNSGGYMGPAGDIITWLSATDWEKHMADDQVGFYEALANSRARSDIPLAALDNDGEVFLTMLGVDVGQEMLLERGAGWRLKGAPKSAHPVVWHYPSYYKRMSQAVGLVTGHWGTRGMERVQTTVALGWGVGILAFLIGCLGGWRWSRGGGGAPGVPLERQARSK